MFPSQNEISDARTLAAKNYQAWGQWVIECQSDADIEEDLRICGSITEWVELRKSIAGAASEIENTAW